MCFIGAEMNVLYSAGGALHPVFSHRGKKIWHYLVSVIYLAFVFLKYVYIVLFTFFICLLQQNKGKKKKKGVVPGGGLKAQLKDDLDYAEFDGGYAQDYEDFM